MSGETVAGAPSSTTERRLRSERSERLETKEPVDE